MLTETERKMLLTFSGLKLDDDVPAGPRAIFEDIQTMYRRVSGGGRFVGREAALAMAIAVVMGRAADMERPEIPTQSPQVVTVKPAPKKRKRRQLTDEQRKALSEKMKAKHRERAEKKALESNG